MELRQLGTRKVGAIGFGAMPIAIRSDIDDATAIRAVHAALDVGMTLIDTADVYTLDDAALGRSEDLVARALASYDGGTDDVLVATKGGMTRDGSAWGTDGSPEWIREACEGSLRRLGVESIDLYQHHRPDPDVAYEDTIGAFRDLADEGKVRTVGLSNADPGQIRTAHEILGEHLVAVQNQYSPEFLSSEPERELCDELGLTFLPWSPLGGMRGAADLATRYAPFAEVAAKHQVSAQQVCLAWHLSRSPRVIPIPGGTRAETITDSARAAHLVLDAEDLAALPG